MSEVPLYPCSIDPTRGKRARERERGREGEGERGREWERERGRE